MKNTLKKAMNFLEDAIHTLEQVEGQNEEIDEVKSNLQYRLADLEFQHNTL